MRWVAVLLFVAVVGACATYEDPAPEGPAPFDVVTKWPGHFPPVALQDDQVVYSVRQDLGKWMFFDPILSKDTTVSCASCHQPSKAFTDGLPLGVGIEGRQVNRNAPTLANLAWAEHLMWDGRFATLEAQMRQPLENPNEMNLSAEEAVARLQSIPFYVERFQLAYNRGPDLETLALALAAFQRTLISATSPYDSYATGQDTNALSPAAKRGLRLFVSERTQCATCHPAPLFTTGGFANNGLTSSPDPGRGAVTGLETDAGVFKIPTLRNVAISGPYLHDGSVATLDELLQRYVAGGTGHPNQSVHVRPFALTSAERQDLLAFLESLTDVPFLTNTNHQNTSIFFPHR